MKRVKEAENVEVQTNKIDSDNSLGYQEFIFTILTILRKCMISFLIACRKLQSNFREIKTEAKKINLVRHSARKTYRGIYNSITISYPFFMLE